MSLSAAILRIPEILNQNSSLAFFRFANRWSRSPGIREGGPVVSLTSYGVRAQSVHLAIESIMQGHVLPSRLILWLDEESLICNLPSGLRRQQKRGLEVKLCENYGPHKKYYPYLESEEDIMQPVVTADDDVFYPRTWLQDLVRAFQRFPDVINCHRARVIELKQDGLEMYRHWTYVRSTQPSFRHFAVGVGGVLYPSLFQQTLKSLGAGFQSSCPRADDIWLHVQAVRAGYKIRQVNKAPFPLLYIPGTQENALYKHNIAAGDNDRQISAMYHSLDIARLRECEEAAT